MKKIKVFALLALLAVSPPLLAAGSGGFPSRPTFMFATIHPTENTTPSLLLELPVSDVGGPWIKLNEIDTKGVANNYEGKIRWYRNDKLRWTIRKSPDGETGSDVGSYFEIIPGNDAGITQSAKRTRIYRSDGHWEFSASPVNTKTCNAGFTRNALNLCEDGQVNNLVTSGTGCVGVGSAITGATGREYILDVQITAGNSAGVYRNLQAKFYTDSSCTTSASVNYGFGVMEFVAAADTTVIYRTTVLVKPGERRYMKINVDTGGTSSGILVYEAGYFD